MLQASWPLLSRIPLFSLLGTQKEEDVFNLVDVSAVDRIEEAILLYAVLVLIVKLVTGMAPPV